MAYILYIIAILLLLSSKADTHFRVRRKVRLCECDFHVNCLHVSRIRPTHRRLNDEYDMNERHRIGVCVYFCCFVIWLFLLH